MLKKVVVTGLFGTFDHTIEFKENPKVTLLLGRNGLGKTVLLKMLFSVFSKDFSYLRKVKFDTFKLYFDSGEILGFTKNGKKKNDIALIFSRPNSKPLSVTFNKLGVKKEELNSKMNSIHDEIYKLYFYTKILESKTVDTKDDIEDLLHSDRDKITVPAWLQEVVDIYDAHLVDTNRMLMPIREKNKDKNTFSYKKAVLSYSYEIFLTFQKVLSESSRISANLDRSFPNKVMDLLCNSSSERRSIITLKDKLFELSNRHELLMSTGLLKSDDTNLPFNGNVLTNDSIAILNIYIEDNLQKLDPYMGLANKLKIFMDLLNSRFLYKKIEFNQEKGFVVTSTKTSDNIELTELSSGEQHLFILFYELLFKYNSKTLLMIDEPEISLHVSWQKHFIDDLMRVVEVNPMTILMATHSPTLIGPYWTMVNELHCDEDF